MSKVDPKTWNSLIWTESPLRDSFRLADLTRTQSGKAEKVSNERTPEPVQKDSFEMVDASRSLYIKSLLG